MAVAWIRWGLLILCTKNLDKTAIFLGISEGIMLSLASAHYAEQALTNP